ncbi:hypothetical protein [Lentzea sp. NBRC 102530]|uniref:hypothetical protein n=1 Tax=Lentzea sp. NBRC 102530 TaxID=3032201 RepID=UPI0024A4ACE4|nr:hypothetical protein [Lentzea sp. NBRC 102530]GLY51642.1 hypothetical protein Lesp01_52980 [Lentzea sp. NBRC 102530]
MMTDLKDLDPARDREPSQLEWVRSTAHVERVIGGTHASERSSRSRRTIIGLAATAAAASVLAGIALVPGATDEAFAQWTPTPGQPASDLVLPQARACASEWGASAPAATDVVLAEQRGIATILILKKDAGLAECMAIGEEVFNYQLLTNGQVEPLSGAGVTYETSSSSGSGDDQYSRIVGRKGPDVTKVEIQLADGRVITAGTGSEWWTAWWPGPEGGEVGTWKVVVHTAQGSTVHDPGELRR